MNSISYTTFLFFYFISCLGLFAQVPYSETNFRSPLDIPLVLAGTFGELRTNHFHAGIDIKTRGKEGFPVIAIDDGYVSRVKTSSGGYGKALYLCHFNGYTSVYAHLQKFHSEIATYLIDEQYKRKAFEVDLFPLEQQFLYFKGDTIAWTGNSGSSSAPHLHFEIRDTKTQEIINPLLFGFKAKDTTPPIIKNLHVYPLNVNTSINGLNDTLRIPIQQVNASKYTIENQNISVHGMIGFGLETFDQLDQAPNKNGVYSIELYVDSSLIYKHDMERFSFSETRYINSFMDYHAKKKYSLKPQKSFKDLNNRLSIYKHLQNEGRLEYYFNGAHQAKYLVKDVAGNTSSIDFSFISDTSLDVPSVSPQQNFFSYDEDHLYENEEITFFIKKNSLYNDINFEYSKRQASTDFLTGIHCIHFDDTPVHIPFSISIVIDSIPSAYLHKALICMVNKEGVTNCLSTTCRGDTLHANSRTFGEYSVVVDTIPPTLKTLSFVKDLRLVSSVSFKVDDALSGLKSYNAYVDGEWILLEYDAKNKKLTHYFDGKINSGQHELEIVVQDMVDNEKRLKLEFVR